MREWISAWMREHVDLVLSYYPPYLGAGIRVRRTEGCHGFLVSMPLRWYNRNVVKVHFGGSLYAMCDPFYMLLLMEALGPDYVVWDKAASIRFRRPGRGRVEARFVLDPAEVERIRVAADRGEVVEPTWEVEVRDGDGVVVARVEKLLYVRRRGSAE